MDQVAGYAEVVAAWAVAGGQRVITKIQIKVVEGRSPSIVQLKITGLGKPTHRSVTYRPHALMLTSPLVDLRGALYLCAGHKFEGAG